MDRETFLNEISIMKKPLDSYEKDAIVNNSLNECKKVTGNYNQILSICMEENAELSVAISKGIRNKLDKVNLLEEMADVFICLKDLQAIYNIDDISLDKAISVKLKRLQDKINKGDIYNG